MSRAMLTLKVNWTQLLDLHVDTLASMDVGFVYEIFYKGVPIYCETQDEAIQLVKLLLRKIEPAKSDDAVGQTAESPT